jgi:hypothetical protein
MLLRAKHFSTQLASSKYAFPIVLFLLCLLAFGLLIPSLGFYWDDWPVVFMAEQGDSSTFREFYSFDRPFSFWTHLIFMPLLGADPQRWQTHTLLLRFLSGFALWAMLTELWPRRKFIPAGTAFLFVVYPTFSQQHISVAYSQHFITFSLFFFSAWAMLRAQRDVVRYRLWTGLALAACALHLFTLEYFVGLELLRPILLLFFLQDQGKQHPRAWKEVFKRWSPYLIVLGLFVIWRLFFLSLPNDPNAASLFASLRSAPLPTVISFVENVFRDFAHILFTVWAGTVHPDVIDFSNYSLLLSIFVGLLTAVLVVLVLFRLDTSPGKKRVAESESWARQSVALGLLAIFLGMLPVRITERDVLSGMFSDRFTIAAMFGAALFWVGMARLALRDIVYRSVLVAILVGLAVSLHLRTSNNFRLDWQKQTRVYWQMYWRVGDLAPQTGIISTGALSGYVSEYSASAAINTLFGSELEGNQVHYWYFDLFDDFPVLEDLRNGMEISDQQRQFTFTGQSTESIYVHYSSNGQCFWLLGPADEHNAQLPIEMRSVARLTNFDRLALDSPENPAVEIFGPEPEHTWCYYYEKMDLARQLGDWPKVLALWSEAEAQGFEPTNQNEMLPLISALVHSDQASRALEVSLDVYARQVDTQSLLCAQWSQWQAEDGPSQGVHAAAQELLAELDCP